MSIIGHIVGGHYQVMNFLGKGGFGETYLAKDLHLPDTPLRVIKRLQSHFSPNEFPTVKKWFDREAQTLYKLNHDRIPKLFAHFKEKNPQFCSDIYALGIVAIQALTGLDPTEFSKDSHTSEIIWRDTVSVFS